MVAPSCCLEYRPTATFWGILVFIVLPFIYICGKVVATFVTVLLRVLKGVCIWALWDDEDYEEEEEMQRLERQTAMLMKEEGRRKRREERAYRRHQAIAHQLAEKNSKMTRLLANGAARNGAAKCPPSDISESLNSECESGDQRVTSPTSTDSAVVTSSESTTLSNGHVKGSNTVSAASETSTIRPRHAHED